MIYGHGSIDYLQMLNTYDICASAGRRVITDGASGCQEYNNIQDLCEFFSLSETRTRFRHRII